MKYWSIAASILVLWIIACKNPQNEVKFTPTGDALIDTLSVRIAENPQDAKLYFDRGQRYIELRKPDKALPDIQKALELDSRNVTYSVALSDVNFQMGKITESRRILEQVYATDPSHIQVSLKLAEISLYFKEYETTEKYLKEAETIDKRDPRLHFMRGFMLKDKGDTLGAVKSFFKTVEYDSLNYDAYLQLGILYAARKDRLAIDFYRHANRIRPGSVEPLYNLGMYYQQQGDLNAAIQAYTDALNVDPKFKYAHFALGYLHVELKIYSEAARHFDNAIKSDPAYLEAYYGRGYALEMAGDVMNAKVDYEKCIQLNPRHEGAREGLQRINRLPPV